MCAGWLGAVRYVHAKRISAVVVIELRIIGARPSVNNKREAVMKVLVTGGAGFIGSAVCRLFVGELGVTVLNVDKLTYAANLASLKAIENSPRYAFRRA